MNRIQDSVVSGNVAGRDYIEGSTYINNPDSGRVTCPYCQASGFITIYKCITCGTDTCDECRYDKKCGRCYQNMVDEERRQESASRGNMALMMLGISVFGLFIIFATGYTACGALIAAWGLIAAALSIFD